MISELLHVGYENRVSREYLMQETGLSERALYLQIHDERENGALILSTKKPGGGYYLPGSLDEMRDYERCTRHGADSLDRILEPTQNEIKRSEKNLTPEDEKSNTEKSDTDE